MQKLFAALLIVVAVPLAFALAQGVVAPTPQGGSCGVQAPPAPRDFWSLTTDDGVFIVPQGRVLVVTGGVLRKQLGGANEASLLVDGVVVLAGKLGGSDGPSTVTIPLPGFRVDPGSSVQVGATGNPSFYVFLGYLADL